MGNLGWIDLALLAALLLSMLVGLWRGLVLEVLALAGWVVAWFAAQWLAPQWAPYLPLGEPDSSLNAGAGFVAAFVVVLIGCALVARLVRLLVSATPLKGWTGCSARPSGWCAAWCCCSRRRPWSR